MGKSLKSVMEEFLKEPQIIQRETTGEIHLAFFAGSPLETSPLGLFLKFLVSLELHNPELGDLNSTTLRSFQNFIALGILPEPNLARNVLQSLQIFCVWCHQRSYTSIDLGSHIVVEAPDTRPKATVLPLKRRHGNS